MASFVPFLMNGEAVGLVDPKDIPPYPEPSSAKPPPRFVLRIQGCDIGTLQRIESDAISGAIEPIRMQAGVCEFLGNIEDTSGGDVCTVRISMQRDRV